ncbi:TPA: hypothetical protein ACH3X2_007633 [Trebouxia sp. C0005]
MQGVSHTFEPVLESSSLAATGSVGVANIPALSLDRLTEPSSKISFAGKAKAKDVLVEKSHGSFGKLNSMLHSFTASKAAKSATVKKASALSDAQIADIRYTSKADFAGSALHILHRGTNSIVYLATAQATGLKLLLKAYDIGKMTGPELAAAKTEIDMLTRLQHEGIARCRGSWQDEKHLYSVEEYGIRGDLFIEMFSERQRLTERFIACKVLSPLLNALVYIHERNIVHRSILPENLHFDKDLNLKLAHFASAVDLDQGPAPCASASVVDYLAPEILKCITTSSFQAAGTSKGGNPAGGLPAGGPPAGGFPSTMEGNIQLFPFDSECSSTAGKVPPLKQKRGGYDQKVDIWAIGCLLFELLTGKGPFEVASKELTCALILWGDIQLFPEKLSQPCVAFIQACLIKNPEKRPSAEQLLQHEWLVKQVQAEAAGVPEGMEFKAAEHQTLSSSGTWLSRQMTKLKSNRNHNSSSSDSIPAARNGHSSFRMPRLWHTHAEDIETGSGSGVQPYAQMVTTSS